MQINIVAKYFKTMTNKHFHTFKMTSKDFVPIYINVHTNYKLNRKNKIL